MSDNNHELILGLIEQTEELPLRDEAKLLALHARVDMILRKVFYDDKKIGRYILSVEKILFHSYFPRSEIIVWNEGQRQLLELLRVIEEDYILSSEDSRKPEGEEYSDRVFIVHGRDEEMKERVARTLTQLRLNPIILHEQTNEGRTIIEKFEEEASDVGYAVVLLSPDDYGGLRGEERRPRARQNVVLELGFFIGKLGRERVCPIVRNAVDFERPSDIAGVVYTNYDEAGAWRYRLCDELKVCGYQISKDDIT